MKNKLYFIFTALVLLFYLNLNYEKNKKINDYLKDEIKELNILNETIYHQFQLTSKVIFNTLVSQDEVIEIFKKLKVSNTEQKSIFRKKLYKLLKNDYKMLDYTKLRQFHFQLPSNESFLRVHKPLKWGDDLTVIRPTIAYVNRYKKPIDGFEIGRIHSGYRFVYPIQDKNNVHLGSVEISFDISVFTAEFMEHFKVLSNLHIKDDIIDNKILKDKKLNYYTKSFINGFYLEKEIIKELNKYINKEYCNKKKPSVVTITKALNSINLGKSISLYDEKINKVVSFLPIKDPITKDVIAFFSIRSSGDYINNTINHFHLSFFLICLLISIIFYNFYRESINKTKIDKMIFNQNKFISMREMIENIAHQYRQPLAQINSIVLNIDDILYENNIQNKHIEKKLLKIESLTKYMSSTVDDFKFIYDKNKKLELYIVQDIIKDSISIVDVLLKKHNIIVELIVVDDIELKGYPNELQQVILVILNNAIDILVEKQIKKPKISINLKQKNTILAIDIYNNGGACPINIIDKIFEPYFTTKHKSQGTGLGLYISKIIIEQSMKGELSVENHNSGVSFNIKLSKILND